MLSLAYYMAQTGTPQKVRLILSGSSCPTGDEILRAFSRACC